MRTARRCPCGSGRLREACDPAELVWCVYGTGESACTRLFHRHSNANRYCPEHAEVRRRERNNAHYARFKKRREEATIQLWEELHGAEALSPSEATASS